MRTAVSSRRAWLCSVLVAAAGCSGGGAPRPDGGPDDPCTARYAVARRRSEIVFALDRSCAMRLRFDGTTGTGPTDAASRWGAARAAISALDAGAAAGWGLSLFPESAASCDVTALSVVPGEMSATELDATLAMDGTIDPFAICAAGTSEVALESGLTAILANKNVGSTGEPLVVVIAAGTPSCGALAENLMALGTSFRDVIVFGLAPDPAAVPLLMAIGEYVEVTSADALPAAIETAVAARASSCVLDLEGPLVEMPDQLRVWVDGSQVFASPDEGWSYEAANSIALNGALCDGLAGGTVTSVDAALGCDERRCVPRDEDCDALDNDCDTIVDEGCP
jgi:hypothetical protein